jgi:uncharacterized protein (UPF0264 family)
LERLNTLCDPVAVAYADCERASAPMAEAVAAFAVEHRWPVLLLDTWKKDGSTLFDWSPVSVVARIRDRCLEAEIRVALAGSLGHEHVPALRGLQPDWLAVRGAVCRYGKRTETLDPARIDDLVRALADRSFTPAHVGD